MTTLFVAFQHVNAPLHAMVIVAIVADNLVPIIDACCVGFISPDGEQIPRFPQQLF